MSNSRKLNISNKMQQSIKVSSYALLVLCFSAVSIVAQPNLRTAVIDGTINAQSLEYGNNEENHDRRTSGAMTWYSTWDNNNFYIAARGVPVNEGAVCYIDRNPISPVNGGTNVDGNLAGVNFDGARYGTLPFRADFVFYFSTTKREWYAANNGLWIGPVSNGGAFASVGGDREFGIPWNAITNGNGRPDRFLYFCYGVSAAGSVYGQVPLQNPNGSIGINAVATHFYHVHDSDDPINKPPFWAVSTSTPPTSAHGSITGSVRSKSGRGVAKMEITLLSTTGQVTTARTNGFGYFVFDEVPFGAFYVIQTGVSKASPISQSRTFQFTESVNDLDFIVD